MEPQVEAMVPTIQLTQKNTSNGGQISKRHQNQHLKETHSNKRKIQIKKINKCHKIGNIVIREKNHKYKNMKNKQTHNITQQYN